MKVIKPLRLGVLHRPWRWRRENHLGIAILALADMSARPRIRPEPELWRMAGQELTGSAAMLDMALPKPCAEFLASGYAYTHHQTQKNACMVKIQVADKEKTLLAFGERFWFNGSPSPALPFDRLRLDWANAYGGEHEPENLAGKGAEPIMRAGRRCHPLPQIERPDQPLGPQRHHTAPVCFGPLDLTCPRQFSRIGKQYDRQWLAEDFPGFARDIDWHLFNRAEPDQWWPQRPALPPGAPWRIWNMHPKQALLQGTLPLWRARCFVNRAHAPDEQLEEVAMRPTTVWFFPHLEQMVLIWHGSCAITEDDAADVRQLTAAMELQQASRPLRHYRQVIHQRSQKNTGAAYALRDKDLMAAGLIAPWLDTEPRAEPCPWAENLSRREQQLREAGKVGADRAQKREPADAGRPYAEQYSDPVQAGSASAEQVRDPGQPAPPSAERESEPLSPILSPPKLDQLPEFMADIARQAAQWQQQAQQKAALIETMAATAAPPTGPEQYHRMLALARDMQSACADSELVAVQTDPDGDLQHSLHEMYRLSADTRPAARPLDAGHSRDIRRRVSDGMAADRDFSDMDFTGADLSGLDLRGANFQRALLESATLDHCLLDDANLSQAMLAHASIRHASLKNVRLDQASLIGARCHNSRFTAARLTETALQQATFSDCNFERAVFGQVMFYRLVLSGCRFYQAVFNDCLFLQLPLALMDFRQSRWSKTTFLEGQLSQDDFAHAQLANCSFIDMALTALGLHNSQLEDCVFAGSTQAAQADFRQARLKNCNFRRIPLTGARFNGAQASACDFSEADLTGADLTAMDARGCLFVRAHLAEARLEQANLMGALLQKSHLAGADLRAANLFRADLSLAFIDKRTRWGQAYIKQCNTAPRREKQP